MSTRKAFDGKPYSGNPHVAPSQSYGGTGRFDEGEVASTATPRRGSLLCGKGKILTLALVVAVSAAAATPENTPDKFVRYVQSSGFQAVDVGVIGKYGTKAEMKLEWTVADQGDSAFLDARGSGETRIFFAHSTGARACAGYGSFVYMKNNNVNVYWEADRIYTVTTEYAVTGPDTVYATFNIDGTEMWKQTYGSKIDTGKNLYLFGANINGTLNCRCKARCYGLKIWQDDANGDRQLMRDFTPCVKNGRAGLYDSVSETIFYSFTGTDLVYDAADDVPDEFVEYVEAHGDSYIDTGIVGRSGTRCDADMMWLKVGADYGFLDARSSSSSGDRIYLIHNYTSKMGIGYGTYNNADGLCAADTRYWIQSDLRAGSQTLVVNGNTEYSGTNPDAYDSGCNLYLFGVNIGGTAGYKSHVRLYGLTIWQDDAYGVEHKVREFRPCMKGGVAALYDAVSETIFYPNGSPLRTDSRLDSMPDAYLEYIESDGRSVIDTWVPARAGIRAQGEFMWTQMRTRSEEQYAYVEPSSKCERTYLGSSGSDNRFFLMHEANTKLWYAYGGENGYLQDNGANVTVASGERYSFDISYLVGSQTIDFNGRRILETTSGGAPDAGYNLYLFGCNYSSNPYYESKARCYGLKLWLDGTLVRDFKPCVKDGKAMLFDAVSRKLFRPSHDIAVANSSMTILPLTGDERPSNYVDYVETDRTIYIDTGVIGRAGTTAEIEMQWLSGSAGDMSLLGARKETDTNSRLFFWHQSTGRQLTYGYGQFMYLPTDSTTATTTYSDSNRHMVEYDRTYHVRSSLSAGTQSIMADDALIGEFSNQNDINTGLNLYLFGSNIAGTPDYLSRVRLYWLKIWQDGVLVRNYLPIRLDSGQVVLWDKVEKRGYVPIDTNGNRQVFSVIGPDGDVIPTVGFILSIR